MKVLIVCSGNFPDPERNFSIHQAFINDQMVAIKKQFDVDFDVFLIKGKGLRGYISNVIKLKRRLKKESYDLVHAHFSLSGIVALAASRLPVVITFHGSDINEWYLNVLSSFTSLLAKHVIFVSEKMHRKALVKVKSSSVIPCGLDFDLFYPQPKNETRKSLGLEPDLKYILFSSAFNIKVKNYPLAKRAVQHAGDHIVLLEVKERSRDQVRELINASDLLLMTSFNEGSPQIIKEAMACNCPVVSTDVGDVRMVMGTTEGCYISAFSHDDIAEKIKLAIAFGKPTAGRKNIGHLDNRIIARKVYDVYLEMVKKKG
jgi:teichuronic acid biosynthesis glycosyltransferase TuaC